MPNLPDFIQNIEGVYIRSQYPISDQSRALIDFFAQEFYQKDVDLDTVVFDQKTPSIRDIVKLSDTHFGIVKEIHDGFIRILEQNYNGKGEGLGCNSIRVNDYFFKPVPEQLYEIQGYYNI